jgi:hypothetical protein
MAKQKISKMSKNPDARPAKKRYWASRKLEKHKVANLMKHCGMSKAEALRFWHEGSTNKEKLGRGKRQGRVPTGYLG